MLNCFHIYIWLLLLIKAVLCKYRKIVQEGNNYEILQKVRSKND